MKTDNAPLIVSQQKQEEINDVVAQIRRTLVIFCGIKDPEFPIEVNEDAVAKRILRCFWVPSKRIYGMVSSGSESLLYFNETDYHLHADHEFGSMIDFGYAEKLIAKGEETGKDYTPAQRKKAIATIPTHMNTVIGKHIKHYYQSNTPTVVADPFCQEKTVEKIGSAIKVTVPLVPYKPLAGDVENKEIVEDYKKHFPMFDDYLRRISTSWFDKGCKTSYLWFKSESNSGKSLLNEGVLGDCGIFTTVNFNIYGQMISGQPCGQGVDTMINSCGVFVDEYTHASKNDMGSQFKFTVNVKGMPVVEVERRINVVANRDDIEGLVADNGLDPQWANRFELIEIGGNIEKRPMYALHGNHAYKAALRVYACRVVNGIIAKLVAMGKDAASKRAADFNREFHEKYAASNTMGNIEDRHQDMADDCIEWIINNLTNEKVRTNVVWTGPENDRQYFLSAPSTVVKEYFRCKYHKDEADSHMKESASVAALLSKDGELPRTRRLRGFVKKCIELRRPDLEVVAETLEEDHSEITF